MIFRLGRRGLTGSDGRLELCVGVCFFVWAFLGVNCSGLGSSHSFSWVVVRSHSAFSDVSCDPCLSFLSGFI